MTNFDPFNKIVKFGQSTMLEKDLFNVSWILSRFCNYNCSILLVLCNIVINPIIDPWNNTKKQ